MNKVSFVFVTLALSISGFAEGHSPSATCPYPADPINWVMRYCGYVAETGDEIAIQESACFKSAQPDLKIKDKCATKKKYKTKTCELMIKNKSVAHKSVTGCLEDGTVDPFFAGEL